MATQLSLGRNRRLIKRQDYLRIQNSGRKVRSRALLVAFVPREPQEDSRIGVTITRKIDKRAVVRNRLRRRLREVFRHERSRFRMPVEMVIVALSESTQLSFEELRNDFITLLQKAKILPWSERTQRP